MVVGSVRVMFELLKQFLRVACEAVAHAIASLFIYPFSLISSGKKKTVGYLWVTFVCFAFVFDPWSLKSLDYSELVKCSVYLVAHQVAFTGFLKLVLIPLSKRVKWTNPLWEAIEKHTNIVFEKMFFKAPLTVFSISYAIMAVIKFVFA